MLDDDAVTDAARRLLAAERSRTPIRQLSLQYPDMTVEDAYCVQRALVALKIEETGVAAGVLGHPANGVAWLANRLAPYDEDLPAGLVILAGSFTRPVFVQAGDVIHADFGDLGVVTCRFR